jgi:hypothetical protein
MAKFLKIPLTGVANTPEILVDMDRIMAVRPGEDGNPATNPTTETTILFGSGNAGFNTLQITHTAAANAGDVLAAFNAAIAANPGGVVSTLGSPVATAQVPQQPSISGAQGRNVVTTEQVAVTYTAFLFA